MSRSLVFVAVFMNTCGFSFAGDCSSTQQLTSWVLQYKSPNYPYYLPNQDVCWSVTVSRGNNIEISLMDFEMSSNVDNLILRESCATAKDWLDLRDGNSKNASLIVRLCGLNKPSSPIKTTANSIFIHMHTDASNSYRGFILEYKGDCNSKAKELQGFIESPNYPNDYPRSSDCAWILDFGPGIFIKVRFSDFVLEEQSTCSFDYVSLLDGPNGSSPVLKGTTSYCGNHGPPAVTHLGPLTIVFKSDKDTAKKGFSASYESWDYDECQRSDACHSNATCSNTFGSYTCQCKSSFTGDGKSCVWYREFDECLVGIHNCNKDAMCVDTRDEFVCKCKTGYVGNGTHCQDIDECSALEKHCHQNATCTNTVGSYNCKCINVYTGDGKVCTDLNECDIGAHNCHEKAHCINEDGGYRCECNTGYQGNGTKCADLDECATGSHQCSSNNSSCHNQVGSYYCVCISGFTGNGFYCTDIDECHTNVHNCHLDAFCLNTNGFFTCKCKNGYNGTGEFCKDVDECLLGRHNCHQKGRCRNSNGSYDCSCEDGFSGDGINCSDIDECAKNVHNCSSNAVCLNNQGAYACSCRVGYSGGGFNCNDVDECAEMAHNCHKHAVCDNSDGSFICTCLSGFKGNGTQCFDVNECNTTGDSCDTYAFCNNTIGSFTCRCKEGFSGDGNACTDVDECTTEAHNCNHNASCQNSIGSYGCQCIIGFSGNGTHCRDVDECAVNSHRCDQNATCINKEGAYDCICKPGYTGNGTSCYDVDECLTGIHLCHRDSRCINERGNHSCICNHGLRGDGFHCEDIDECGMAFNDCNENASCLNTEASYVCRCHQGFSGDGFSCSDINECSSALHNCSKDAICGNSVGSYQCHCMTGYSGNGFVCMDIDECIEASHQCSKDGTCNNTVGSYECGCLKGYTGNGFNCTDQNECEESIHHCHANALCSNTVGSFTCKCSIGYSGNGIQCMDTNECLLSAHKCHSDAICVNSKGSYNCFCMHGYSGNGTECMDVNECESELHNCSVNGSCTNQRGRFDCFCDKGFSGDGVHCNDIDECQFHNGNCSPNAFCMNSFGSYLCKCSSGFTGNGHNCSDVDECSTALHNCHQNASCINNQGTFSCVCNSGYSGNGTDCMDVNECLEELHNCHSDAHCQNSNGSYSCICARGYHGNGTLCSDVNECEQGNHICHDDALCFNKKGSYNCQCKDGYNGTGSQCSDINECQKGLHDCDKSAHCKNTQGNFTCSCFNGYRGSGKHCLDVNECQEDLQICHANASCNNTAGSFGCFCNHGHFGDGNNCSDIDECDNSSHNCSVHAHCNNTIGSFACNCRAGFSGGGELCYDIDECRIKVDACHKFANCSNTQGSYICLCLRGYSGNGMSCQDIDECQERLHACHSYANCKNALGSYHCSCRTGYAGDGKYCIDINECQESMHNCNVNSWCRNTNGSFECKCKEGYSGDGLNCKDVDECSLAKGESFGHTCDKFANCTNIDGSFFCNCTHGFQGDGKACQDTDECTTASHGCHSFAACINTLGSYVCNCNEGFTGTGFLCREQSKSFRIELSLLKVRWDNQLANRDSDAFKILSLKVEAEVKGIYNNNPNFVSVLVQRFRFGSAKAILDVLFKPNETKATERLVANVRRGELGTLKVDPNSIVIKRLGFCNKACSIDADCIQNDKNMSFCSCMSGYAGDGYQCTDINECEIVNGGCNHICENTNGSYHCKCNSEFSLEDDGRTCSAKAHTALICNAEWKQNLKWEASTPDSFVTKKCPESHAPGLSTRACLSNGKWGVPVMKACVRQDIKSLHEKMKKTVQNLSWNESLRLLDQLPALTDPGLQILYAGDLVTSMEIITLFLKFANRTILQVNKVEVDLFMRALMNAFEQLVHERNQRAWEGMNEISDEVHNLIKLICRGSQVYSTYLLGLVKKSSLTNPDLFKNLMADFESKSLGVHIRIVEQSTFLGYELPNSTLMKNATFQIKYPTTLFRDAVGDKVSKGIYTHLGCYADKATSRALPNAEETHPLLTGNFLTRKDAINKCAVVAKERGFTVFGIQDGGWCAMSRYGHHTYNKYGKMDNCMNGKGGMLSFDVYSINYYYVGLATIELRSFGHLLFSEYSRKVSSLTTPKLGTSLVTGLAVHDPESYYTNMPVPITVILKYSSTNTTSKACAVAFNSKREKSLQWQFYLNMEKEESQGFVKCSFFRLGTFMVVSNYSEQKVLTTNAEDFNYKTASYCCCALSSLCLIFSMLSSAFSSNEHHTRTLICNQSLLAIVFQILFIFGLSYVEYHAVCKLISICLHFIILANLAWSVADCGHLYRCLSLVSGDERPHSNRPYYAIGYGFPIAIIALSLAVYFDKYGLKDTCWLSERIVISLLVPPAIILLIANVVLFGMVIGVYYSPRETINDGKDASLFNKRLLTLCARIKASAVISAVLFITLAVAVGSILHRHIFLKYCYLVVNLVQGFTVFYFRILLNEEIWLSVKDKFKKQRDLQSSREFGAYNKSFADSDSLMQDLFMLHAKSARLPEKDSAWDTRM